MPKSRLSPFTLALLIAVPCAPLGAQLGLPPISAPPVGGAAGVGGSGSITGQIGVMPGPGPGRIVDQIPPAQLEQAVQPSLTRYIADQWVRDMPPRSLAELRRMRLSELVRESRGTLEMDSSGNPATRGRVIAIDPPEPALGAAIRAGLAVTADDRDVTLGMRIVTFALPGRMTTSNAVRLLRRAAPGMTVEVDHIFEPAGGTLAASNVALAAASVAGLSGARPLVGMIDGGVGQTPALAAAAITQKSFTGQGQATGHGTAVASLIVGSHGNFRGAAPGVSLLVGDVYGGNPAAGSATIIVRALSWIAAQRPDVINISLVGPRNALVERAVAALHARNIKLVAAVGNDGPAAPPLYPASHPGVIAVTAVDGSGRALAEAGRATHLDYAAPGADLAAAMPGRGYTIVRGTSFAAPFVAARLALTGSTARLDAEASKGHGRVGRGIICRTCRILPRQVGAR